MFKRASLSFTILAVATIMVTAGWLLWSSQDPQLTDVEFETVLSTTDASDIPRDVAVAAEQPADTLTETNDDTVSQSVTVDATVLFEADSATTNINSEITGDTAPTTNNSIPAVDDAAVIVSVLGTGVKEHCPVTITATTTVHKVMQIASRQCGFSYSGEKQGNLGFYVKEVAGLSQSVKEGYYWIFSVNGEKSQLGVSTRTVEPDDTIQWTYEAEY